MITKCVREGKIIRFNNKNINCVCLCVYESVFSCMCRNYLKTKNMWFSLLAQSTFFFLSKIKKNNKKVNENNNLKLEVEQSHWSLNRITCFFNFSLYCIFNILGFNPLSIYISIIFTKRRRKIQNKCRIFFLKCSKLCFDWIVALLFLKKWRKTFCMVFLCFVLFCSSISLNYFF